MNDDNTPWKLDDVQQSFVFGADTTIVARVDETEARFPRQFLSTIITSVNQVAAASMNQCGKETTFEVCALGHGHDDKCLMVDRAGAALIHERTREEAQKRIMELAGMLNKAHEVGKVQVEGERDACVRKVQFFLEVAEKEGYSEDWQKALKVVLGGLAARKDPMVQQIDEMASGTLIGEFVEACVARAVRAKRVELESFLEQFRIFLKARSGESISDLVDAWEDLDDFWTAE